MSQTQFWSLPSLLQHQQQGWHERHQQSRKENVSRHREKRVKQRMRKKCLILSRFVEKEKAIKIYSRRRNGRWSLSLSLLRPQWYSSCCLSFFLILTSLHPLLVLSLCVFSFFLPVLFLFPSSSLRSLRVILLTIVVLFSLLSFSLSLLHFFSFLFFYFLDFSLLLCFHPFLWKER